MAEYSLEMARDELGIVVEALRVQRERWNETLLKKMANDESVSEIDASTIQRAIALHDALLDRLPDKGMSF